ncbi:uncharacterized protein (DUF58 family) [Evansella vedderi]|uniref:Uncharacterized protein (DUF58 family) n=1 Tax=Evansella vedderi TaxID=38282 RepID=A0ABT9ZS85_9BACI|nr:DUF58 domain-containing protein [Evansella vedderi]MDQ0254085.1 uncharacterized protein (DUF58 family) [Evansella vedderi]
MRKVKNIWNWTKFIVKGLFVIGLFVGMFSYAMFQGGFVSWFLFYTISVLVVLMLLYASIPLGSFHVTRNFGDTAIPSGSNITVTVTIRRKWPFPFLYLFVKDVIDNGLKKQTAKNSSKMIFYPTIKREIEFSYDIPEMKRGEYNFYGVQLETSDMFGLFNKRKFVPMEETLLVYPNYHEIERWSPYEKHETETRLNSPDYVEDVTSVAGAREYVPGDKLTSIDWKVTARSGKLMTKEFEEFIGQNFLIILNNHLPEDDFHTVDAYEKSIELVTSIVMHAHRKQLLVGLWTLGNKSNSFPLDSGNDHQKRLVYHLSTIQGREEVDFASKLKEYEKRIPVGTTLIFASTELTDAILERIKLLLSRRAQVYFCLLDRGVKADPMEVRRLEELRHKGAEAYILSGGNIDHAIPSYAGD